MQAINRAQLWIDQYNNNTASREVKIMLYNVARDQWQVLSNVIDTPWFLHLLTDYINKGEVENEKV